MMKFVIVLIALGVANVLAQPIMFGSIESTIPDINGPEDALGNLAERLDKIELSHELDEEVFEHLTSVFEILPNIGSYSAQELEEVKNSGEVAFTLEPEEWARITTFCRQFHNDVGVVLTEETLQIIRERGYAIHSPTINNIVGLWNICEVADNNDNIDDSQQ